MRELNAEMVSSKSSSSNRSRKSFKRCCRNFVTFMCTQVGVGALIVFYTICGAASFQKIEENVKDNRIVEIRKLRIEYVLKLWRTTETLNLFNKSQWQNKTDVVLQNYQTHIATLIKQGYDFRSPSEIWTFPAALMFSLSVITMIGYGNMVPRTPWGKGFTVVYATFGIPLYILYFLNMGKVLARCFQFLYRSLHECTHDRTSIERRLDALESGSLKSLHRKKIIVPSTACLWVIILYILTGTIMFDKWEKWSFLNSFYFCMSSLCKIGFGDFVPGASTAFTDSTDTNWKLAINFIYMLVGMGLVAMCYKLMREEVRVKLREMKEDTKICFEDTRSRFLGCCSDSRRDIYRSDPDFQFV